MNFSGQRVGYELLVKRPSCISQGWLAIAEGRVFLGCDQGLFKSADKGKSWKQVQNGGWVMDIVEAEGVLVVKAASCVRPTVVNTGNG